MERSVPLVVYVRATPTVKAVKVRSVALVLTVTLPTAALSLADFEIVRRDLGVLRMGSTVTLVQPGRLAITG